MEINFKIFTEDYLSRLSALSNKKATVGILLSPFGMKSAIDSETDILVGHVLEVFCSSLNEYIDLIDVLDCFAYLGSDYAEELICDEQKFLSFINQ